MTTERPAILDVERLQRIAEGRTPDCFTLKREAAAELAGAYLKLLEEAGTRSEKAKHPADDALDGVLDEIEDYLEQRQDVRDGPEGEQRPNEAMSLLTDLRWWRSSAKHVRGDKPQEGMEKLRAEEIEEFNSGYDAFKAGIKYSDLPDLPHDNNGPGWAWGWFMSNRPDLQERVTNDQTFSDDDLRRMWRAAGGHFFGPHVEHGAMPEVNLLRFLRELVHVGTRSSTSVVDAEPPQPSLYDRPREETLRLAREVLGCAIPTGEGRQAILWAKRFANEVIRSRAFELRLIERADKAEREAEARAREACTYEGRTGCSFARSASSQWISVEERLPEERIRVLAWDGMMVEDCFYGISDDRNKDDWACHQRRTTAEQSIPLHPITHWMPLPSGPRAADRGKT